MSKLPPIKLKPVDELFNIGEAIDYLYITQLETFKNHPFSVEHNAKMEELIESIKANGIYTPILVRPIDDDKYEIVAGHRRTYAAQKAGLNKVPCIIREMSDDDAVIAMVDTNHQRENTKPSEKAFAYKMKMEALKRKAGRPSKNNSCQVGTNLRTDELLAANSDDSARQIQRYIRLTNLIPSLLHQVDIGNIKLSPAVELSYLSEAAQNSLEIAMETEGKTKVSLAKARKIRAAYEKKNFDLINILEILSPSDAKEENYLTVTLKIDIPYEIVDKVKEEDLKRICNNYIKSMEIKQ